MDFMPAAVLGAVGRVVVQTDDLNVRSLVVREPSYVVLKAKIDTVA